MSRAVVAPNAFTGSLSSPLAAAALARGMRSAGWDAVEIPVADGGPGTSAVLEGRTPPRVAVVEMAEHAGLGFGLDPLGADTLAVGRAVVSAAGNARAVWVGLGGSRTTDGGTGFARALGWRFLDGDGRDLPLGGGALVHLAHVERGAPASLELVGLCDVRVPLAGAATVFASQKGASPAEIDILRRGLERLEAVIGVTGDFPGAGSAGGLGYGLVVFAGARLEPGVEVVARAVGLDTALRGADLCVTGEGSLDSQTLEGKAPWFVAERAAKAGVPLALVAGRVDAEVARALRAVACVALEDLGPNPLSHASAYLEEAGRRLGAGTVAS